MRHPLPVLIGGGASAAVLRRVARHGQGWIPAGMTAADIAEAMPRLRDAMVREGRVDEPVLVQGRAGKIDTTATTAGEVVERLAALAASGCTGALVDLGETTGSSLAAVHDAIAWCADTVLPAARDLPAGS